MTLPAEPTLTPGRAYRTGELRRWGRNPARLVQRLLREGRLCEAAHGLYYAPIVTHFGPAPASDEALLRAFLGAQPFVVTGPPRWNSLGLGSTAMFASTLVYNTQRTGEFTLDGRRFLLRRVLFPRRPPPEWFIVDLVQHHQMAGVARSELRAGLVAMLRAHRWDTAKLREMSASYGTKATMAFVDTCLAEAQVAT